MTLPLTGDKGRLHPVGLEGQAGRRLGDRPVAVRQLRLDLAQARENLELGLVGTALWAFDASDLAAEATIRFNEQGSDALRVTRGFFIRGVPFSKVYVSNVAQAGKTLTLVYAVEGERLLQIENPLIAFQQVQLSKSAAFGSSPDITLAANVTTVVRVASSVRRRSYVQNLSSNVDTVRIGDSGMAGGEGIELQPGQTMLIETTAAIYARSTGTPTLAVAEEVD